MSEFHDIIADVVSDRRSSTTTRVVNLRTGLEFRAEVEPVADMILNTELGRDARESVLLHVARDEAEQLAKKDDVEFVLFGQLERHRILRRSYNAANPLVEFGCMKIVVGKDT